MSERRRKNRKRGWFYQEWNGMWYTQLDWNFFSYTDGEKKPMEIREIIINDFQRKRRRKTSSHFVTNLPRTLCLRVRIVHKSIIMMIIIIIAWVIFLSYRLSQLFEWTDFCWQDNSIKCATLFVWYIIYFVIVVYADRFSNSKFKRNYAGKIVCIL